MTFSSYEEIISAWYTGRYDIWYEKGGVRYEVRRIGSTIYCYDQARDCGVGAINRFDLSGFSGEERVKDVEQEEMHQ